MKYTLVGDPHCTPQTIDKIEKLFDEIEDLGHPVIILGDVFDTKEVIRGKCLNTVFKRLSKSKLKFIILVGNHDLYRLDEAANSLEVFKALPNVEIIDQLKIDDDNNFIMFPYIHDKALLKNMIESIKNKDKYTVFGHFDISGFDYGNGAFCEDEIITYNDFQEFKRVVSGHFHKLQKQGNLTYIGTPFSHTFGESNQEKVIGVLDLDVDNLELIHTNFPRHVSIKVNIESESGLKKIRDFVNKNKQNIMRIQLGGSQEAVVAFNKSEFDEYNIKWEDKSDAPDTIKGISLEEGLDNKTQFRQWANDIKRLDTATIELGLQILETLNAK